MNACNPTKYHIILAPDKWKVCNWDLNSKILVTDHRMITKSVLQLYKETFRSRDYYYLIVLLITGIFGSFLVPSMYYILGLLSDELNSNNDPHKIYTLVSIVALLGILSVLVTEVQVICFDSGGHKKVM